MTGASQAPTERSLTFVEGALPGAAARIFEVGCGAGELAAALMRDGHRVQAVESSAAALEAARARGVDARAGRFPEVHGDDQAFDAVFLGRVLHHVTELEPVLERALAMLVPGGRLIVEDYAWERVDGATAAWIRACLEQARELGGRPESDWDLRAAPLEAWHANTRDERLFTSVQMRTAIEARFEGVQVAGEAYAYRWTARYLAQRADAEARTRAALERELAAIEAGNIVPIGWRCSARAPRDASA